MQDTGVFTAGNNRRISEAAALPDEFMGKLRLDLQFLDSWFDASQHAPEARRGQSGGFANEFNFQLRFHDAQAVEQLRQAVLRMERVACLASFEDTRVA